MNSHLCYRLFAGMFLVACATLACCRERVTVTKDNFARAETRLHFARFVERGALGHFYHFRRLGINDQPGMRPNTDAYHSVGVFDLDAGPVTITLPEAGERFQSMSIINEENLVVGTDYNPGPHSYSREQAGSRYIIAIVRLFTDGELSLDSQIVHGLQDELAVQQAGAGQFDIPAYDTESLQQVRLGLRALASSMTSWRRAAGSKQEVDLQQHLAATAADWGLPDEDDAQFFHRVVIPHDGSGVFELILRDVPADGFWSVSVGDSTGHVPQEAYDQFTINNTTAHKDPNGQVVIQFGGCEDGAENCLPIFPGWQYTLRLYQPRPDALDGSWKEPLMEQLR